MCLFPKDNKNRQSLAYQLGLHEFECGVCPECLAKRARHWALRCMAEAKTSPAIMITLTYDDYKYDSAGRCIGELPPKKLECRVDHVQKFIKRLRKWQQAPIVKEFRQSVSKWLAEQCACVEKPRDRRSAIARLREHYAYDIEEALKERLSKLPRIKYMVTAEHGSRTGRAHYHAILFNVSFDDKIFYKKSKRGNIIYKSKTLTDLWGKGICTIDSINVSGKVARYCTKYCAKDSRCNDTFMLFSRDIGTNYLINNFNGLSYIMDGAEYPIPKLIWNKYIEKAYQNNYVFNLRAVTYKYRSFDWFLEKYDTHTATQMKQWWTKRNRLFGKFKRMNSKFKKYLEYWSRKAEINELNRPNALERILALSDDKYHMYKVKAIQAQTKKWLVPPREHHKTVYKWSFDSSSCDYSGVEHCQKRFSYVANNPLFLLYGYSRRLDLPRPLVNKGQMTPKSQDYIKTVRYINGKWIELRDFYYKRSVSNPFRECFTFKNTAF